MVIKNNLVEALIGALVLVVAGAFIAFTYSRTDIGRVSGTEFVARFNRADGLPIGADVRMSGIKVGRVVKQELDPRTYQALVRFSVDPKLMVPEDSSVRIASEGLLGGNYLNVVPGGADEPLPAGAEFEFTQDSIDLMGLLGQAIFAATGKSNEDKDAAKASQ